MAQADRITTELIDPPDELHFAIVPKVHMIGGELGILTCRDNQNEVAFADHLDDFDTAFNASLDPEPERLQ